MKYTSFLILLLLVFLAACKSGENKTEAAEPNHFTSSKTIKLLSDVQLMESLVNTHGDFYNKDEQNILFQSILDKHQVSRQDLDSILEYLENNLEYFQLVLDSIKTQIEMTDTIDLPFLLYKDTLKTKVKPIKKLAN